MSDHIKTLSDGELINLMPSDWATDVQVRCLSRALQGSMGAMLARSDETVLYGDIDRVPETVLDVMATDNQAPYYDQSLPVTTRRSIVKSALPWHEFAGTPAAVEELLRVVFGRGEVIEWFDFDEPDAEPYTFDVTTDMPLTPDSLNQIVAMIRKVKNERSHLRRVTIDRDYPGNARVAAGTSTSQEARNDNNVVRMCSADARMRIAGGAEVRQWQHNNNNVEPRERTARGFLRTAAAAWTTPDYRSGILPRDKIVAGCARTAAATWTTLDYRSSEVTA